MKKKLTITVDADVLPLAKRYARSRGVSLSSLVEQALRDLTEEPEPPSPVERDLKDSTEEPEPSFVDKWRGKFRPITEAEIDSARYEYLAQKYNL